MEPMTLGSPVGSPAAAPSSPGGTSPYLPEFLMGNDSMIGIGSSTPNIPVSPSKLIKHVTFGATPTLRSSTPASAHQDRRTNREVNLVLRDTDQDSDYTEEGHFAFREHPRRLNGKSEKTSGNNNGPPTCGLFDTLSMPSAFQPKNSADLLQQKLQSATDLSFSEASWTAEHESGNAWVTIFGFQPNASSYILSQFAHYGNIIQKKMPLKGNWIHVQYSSKIECRKALSYNGKIFGGSIMIGVIPCRDKEIITDMRNKENVPFHSSALLETSLGTSRQDIVNQSLLSNSSFGTPSKFNASNLSYASPEGRYANNRPLGQAYRMAQAESEISPQGAVPRKSNSMVSKAMEYVFGW